MMMILTSWSLNRNVDKNSRSPWKILPSPPVVDPDPACLAIVIVEPPGAKKHGEPGGLAILLGTFHSMPLLPAPQRP